MQRLVDSEQGGLDETRPVIFAAFVIRLTFRYIDYRQIHKQLDMAEVEPFDVDGRFGHVDSVVHQVADRQGIENNLPDGDFKNFREKMAV